ncbi:MAG: hypothetical protein ABIH41_05265 [Nanoarchaeota archaeon]
MARITRLFWELKMEIMKVSFLRAFLNAIVIFLIADIILTLFDISYWYAAAIGAAFLLINMYAYYQSTNLRTIEDKNPDVREMLRTVKDNLSFDNFMIRALHQDVLRKARSISTGNILNYKHVLMRVVAIVILCGGMVMLASVKLHVPTIHSEFRPFDFSGFSFGTEEPVDLTDTQLLETDDIYGDVSVAKLGNKELNLNMNPSSDQMDLLRKKDIENLAFSRNTYPVEATAVGAETSAEKRPEESDLVNAFYMKKLRS